MRKYIPVVALVLFCVGVASLVALHSATAQAPGGSNVGGMRLSNAADPSLKFITWQQSVTQLLPNSRYLYGGGFPLHQPPWGPNGFSQDRMGLDINSFSTYVVYQPTDPQYLLTGREEFMVNDTAANVCPPGWACTGTTRAAASITLNNNGVLSAGGDGAAAVGATWLGNATLSQGYLKDTNAPTIYFKTAQLGTGAGTRRCGVMNTFGSTTPTDGFWIENTNGGAYTFVMRSANVTRSTTASATNAANGVFHVLGVASNGAGNYGAWVDPAINGGVAFAVVGPFTQPTVGLYVGCANSTVTAADGNQIDFIDWRWTR